MKLQEYQFPQGWFEDEVRDGFFVSSTMKRNWAGQIEVLKEVDRVCKELGLTWYLLSGTLLGAVRHQGFIPWDDDVDICMMRRDIEIFRKKAYPLLPEGYFILDPRDEPDVSTDVFRVVSSRALHTDQAYLQRNHAPFILGVDMFPLDNYLEDEEYEANRMKLMTALKYCVRHLKETGDTNEDDYQKYLKYAEESTGVCIHEQPNPIHELWTQMVVLYSQVTDDTTPRVKVFFGDEKLTFDRNWFGKPRMILFEGIELPAPAEYEKELQVEFGNRKYIGRGGTCHGYPYYEEQEIAFAKELGIYPFRYKFRPEDLEHQRAERPRQKIARLFEMLDKLQNSLKNAESRSEVQKTILISEQKILAALTDMLTPLFPMGEEAISGALREFGERIFQTFSEWKEDSFSQLESASEYLKTTVRDALANRAEIVFLPCRAAWWGAMEKLWKYAKELSDTNVQVCPIPWYEEPDVHTRGTCHDESTLFPDEVELTSRFEINLRELQPEAIVIQVPYDSLSREIMIDEEYYSYKLRDLTDKLIYVPCFVPDTPSKEDEVSVKALASLIEQPAVMFADEVRVPSSRMREIYIDTLTKLSGEEKRIYWQEKIKSDDRMEISIRDTIFHVGSKF